MTPTKAPLLPAGSLGFPALTPFRFSCFDKHAYVGDIQRIAAEQINVSVTGMLAVQVAGATLGNCVCINNILSAKAVMGLVHVGEGEFIRRTAPIGFLFGILAQVIGLMFTLGNLLPDGPIGPTSSELQTE
jgi:hypothetical protein